jgi:ElaB/YqjD/DUF883 family membrane-anchored ribosome-binding protein
MKSERIDPDSIDLDFLKQEFSRFRDELAGMKGKMGSNASEALDQITAYLNGDGLSSRLNSMQAELEALAGKFKDTGKDAVTRLEQQVGERPIISVAVAFGVGVLVSQLFRRS